MCECRYGNRKHSISREREKISRPKLKLTDVEASKASQFVLGEGFLRQGNRNGKKPKKRKNRKKLIKEIKEPIDRIHNKLISILFASQPFITNLEHHPVKLLSKS